MIYLDNAATSWPKPEAVYKAMDEFSRNHAANPGKGGHRMAMKSAERIAEVRGRVAKLVHAEDDSRVVLTLNATDALNMAIKGCLRKGDHVVTSLAEHFSVSRPLASLEESGFITVTRVTPVGDGTVPPEEIAKSITPKTRMIAVTHCSNVVGTVNPLADYGTIAREHGPLLLVDAAQTAGIVDIDAPKLGVDLLAMTGHKSLYGPMGTGALYVRKGVVLQAWREGPAGPGSSDLHPADMPFHMEGGTPNAPGLAGLSAGLAYVEETGLENIRKHKVDLAFRFLDRIRDHGKIKRYGGENRDRHIGSVSLTIDGAEPSNVGRILDEKYGIGCRPGIHCAPGMHRFLGTHPQGTIRFSFGMFNTEADVDAASRAILEIAG